MYTLDYTPLSQTDPQSVVYKSKPPHVENLSEWNGHGFSGLWSAGNQGMEKTMEITVAWLYRDT